MEGDKLLQEIAAINKSCLDIQVSQAEMTAELKYIRKDVDYHVRRTDLLERKVEQVDRDVTKFRGFATIGGWVLSIIVLTVTVIGKILAFI